MIAAVVLAAGESSRLGRPKQLVRIRGRTLLRRAIDAARGVPCDPVIAVLGANHDALVDEATAAGARVARNDSWRGGLGTSIRAGVSALEGCDDVGAALLLPCDQPALTAVVLSGLVAAYRASNRPMAACAYAGVLGTPAIFARSEFRRLLALGDGEGANRLLRASPARVAPFPWDPGARDVDRPEDLGDLA